METWKGESVGGIEREIGRVFALCVGAAAGRVRFGIACLADTVLLVLRDGEGRKTGGECEGGGNVVFHVCAEEKYPDIAGW